MSVRRLSDMNARAKSVAGSGPRLDARWAVLLGGTVTRVTNADGTIDEVRTFSVDGTLLVVSPGFARVLWCGSGGSNGGTQPGGGGMAFDALDALPAGALPVVVGQLNGTAGAQAGATTFNGKRAGGGWTGGAYGTDGGAAGGGLLGVGAGNASGGAVGAASGVTAGSGLFSDITGVLVEYGKGATATVVGAGPGAGGAGNGTAAKPGILIVRTRASA